MYFESYLKNLETSIIKCFIKSHVLQPFKWNSLPSNAWHFCYNSLAFSSHMYDITLISILPCSIYYLSTGFNGRNRRPVHVHVTVCLMFRSVLSHTAVLYFPPFQDVVRCVRQRRQHRAVARLTIAAAVYLCHKINVNIFCIFWWDMLCFWNLC